MNDNILAKNLLLNRNCYNCKNAGIIAGKDTFQISNFEKLTGISKESIHDGCIINNQVIMCYNWFKMLPLELTCERWEKSDE